MKIASLAEIKKELNYLSEKELIAIITDLSKFNIDNKKFLFFKLHEKDNPRLFIEMVQEELQIEFQNAKTTHYHQAKKSAQGIRRKLNKFLKISKDKTAHIELIVDFCRMLKENDYLKFRHPVIDNLYKMQVGKIEKLIGSLHEDLQYDFQEGLDDLKEFRR